jgi:hypothetical protein
MKFGTSTKQEDGFATTILDVSLLVLLMRGMYKVHD